MNEPTRITFNLTALTADQRDGLACVVCGRDYLAEAVPTPHVPVGMVGGTQVFACTSHVAARRATWPGGEPAEVRAAAERMERIRALHRAQTIQVDDDGEAAEVTVCVHCDGLRELLDDEAAPVLYPCDTIRALDGAEAGQ